MGEAMGPNTVGALHAGADFMAGQMAPTTDRTDASAAEDEFLQLREKRKADMQAVQASRFGGSALLIGKNDWQREVVTASKGAWVVTLVRAPTRMEGDAAKADVSEAVDVLAKKYLNVKFVEIRAEDAVPPSRYETLPSIFVYQDGSCRNSLIGTQLAEDGSAPTVAESIEWKLAEFGVFVVDGAVCDEGVDEGGSGAAGVD
eukprot:CAMPEP_0119465856 /NCGR_PEP_ID=MMETSP1344-20130328/789_1 /TAXON_ID=236787 /ORGANISM="Florenciella parvula, Strain CCMP2471" /LENGTH=201 /DNA_ID=CAMNT_0007498141 /DNA_START=216 /DNA_END=821 /DNA_ORIENTATION=+